MLTLSFAVLGYFYPPFLLSRRVTDNRNLLAPTITYYFKKVKILLKICFFVKICRDIIKLTKKDITKYFEDAIKQEPSVLIDTLIEKIVLYNDKKEIYFNSPLKDKSPDDKSQGFLFNRNFNYNGQNSEIVSYYLWF